MQQASAAADAIISFDLITGFTGSTLARLTLDETQAAVEHVHALLDSLDNSKLEPSTRGSIGSISTVSFGFQPELYQESNIFSLDWPTAEQELERRFRKTESEQARLASVVSMQEKSWHSWVTAEPDVTSHVCAMEESLENGERYELVEIAPLHCF